MSYFLAEGSKFLFSTTFGSAITVNSASNADPTALVTAVAHSLVPKDVVLFNSGWEDARDSVWQVASAAGSNLTLGSLDTSDVQWYPAGAGVGTLQKVTNFLEIGQVLDVNPSGGGTRNVDIAPLSRRNGIRMPAGFEASSLDFTIGFDPSLTEQIALDKISRALGKKVAFQFLLAGGATGFGYGNASLSPMPKITKGGPVTKTLTVSFLGQFVGYPTAS